MTSVKLLFCFSIFFVTLSFTSCQGSSNETQVTTTERPDDDEATETIDVKDESESESETESDSESESESDSESDSENETEEDDASETTEKPKNSEESGKSEKPAKPELKKKSAEKKEDEIDLEDDPVPKPRCLARYNNLNCTEAQKQQAISNYKATRGQLIQNLLQHVNGTSSSNKTASVTVAPVLSLSNSTQSLNITTSSNSTASSSSSSTTTAPTTASTSATSGIRSCDRAVQLLANVDQYVRFNDSCQARVFGKRNNPDYWISRCMRSLRRHH